MLSDQAIGLSSALGTYGKRGSHLHGRNSLPVGSSHRALVSARHLEQVGEPSAWEKLTCCRIRPSGSRQRSAPRASGGGICMGETHPLKDQATGFESTLGTESKRESHLHGRNSQAVGSGHRARVSTRHLEQKGEPSAWEKLTCCRIRSSGSRQRSVPKSKRGSHMHGRNLLAVGSGHRALVSARHLRARGGAICMGETHRLSYQVIGLSSALGT